MELATTGVSAASKLEPKRMAAIAFLVLGFVLAMFLSRVAAAALAGLHVNDSSLLGIDELTISLLIGFVIAIAAGVALWLNPKIQEGAFNIASELKRVTWPSFAETRVSTIAVIIASFVAAGILFVFDMLASQIMTHWVPAVLSWIARF